MKALSVIVLGLAISTSHFNVHAIDQGHVNVAKLDIETNTSNFRAGISIQARDLSENTLPELRTSASVFSGRESILQMPSLGETQVRLALQARSGKKSISRHPLLKLRDSLNLRYDIESMNLKTQLNIRKRRLTLQYSDHLKFEINDIGKESQFTSLRYEIQF